MSSDKSRLYEGMYILNSNLSEEARKSALNKIKSAIIEKKGEIHKVHDMGKRKLAFEINKKREGYYYLLYFSIPSPAIDSLWKEYLLNEDLIRFTTMKTDKILESLEFKPIELQF